jgi:nucleoside-diphosphate-sugar epimerase
MKVLITGKDGYVARNFKPLFEQLKYEVLTPSSNELDMTNLSVLKKYFDIHDPDFIVHTANKGGKRGIEDTYENFLINIVMFENLMNVIEDRPTVIFGSGAEFDRRHPILRTPEDNILKAWPIDLYGLSKNIITRQVLSDYKNKRIYIFRLFGCFNYNENSERFIRNSIQNIKKGVPIVIHQNKEMDFFYLDDVFTIVEHFLCYSSIYDTQDINIVYYDKYTLLDIANMIVKYTSHLNPQIKLDTLKIGNPYSGDNTRMYNILYKNEQIKKLIGLEEGIRQTCNKIMSIP